VSNYCPLPFRHVFVEPRGVKPCCSYTKIFNGTIAQWFNSAELYELQQDILSNKVNAGCASCITNENRDGYSTRLSGIKEYPSVVKDTKIDYVDYRSKNICNFKCRSCEPYFSNGIAQEVRHNAVLEQFYQAPNTKVAEVDDSGWILKNIRQIRRLMFTGGEPTKIAEVRTILDYIVENHLDTNVLIISNGSFTDPYWRNITQQISNINWTISLDAVGPVAEIIRHGTQWNIVAENVKWLFNNSPSINISTVISNLNIAHISELFGFVNSLAQKYQHRNNGRTQFIEICNWPTHLNPHNWPDDLKQKVLGYLDSIDTSTLQPRQCEVIQRLINNIKQTEFDSAQWAKFELFNKTLDNIRGENYSSLFKPLM
jgi:pyruvate-formate lyase-activating enzyme